MRNICKKFTCTIFLLVITLFAIGSSSTKAQSETAEINKIPIAMATDNNYVYPTIVAITSMLENKKENTYLDFHIMISGQVSRENRNRLTKLKSLYKGCSIELIDMKNNFNNTYIFSDYITKATYYRLLLPNILNKYDKILYLDGDIIVRKDLWDMYSIDLKNNYIGAVKDYGQIAWKLDYAPDYAKRLGTKDMSQLINAGILIMNLQKMREDKMQKKFNDFIPTLESRRLYLNDQDVLNATCYDRIKFISPEYNAMQHFVFNYDAMEILIDCYNMKEWKKACTDPTIIHYTSMDKPWKGFKGRFYNEWDKYRKIVEKKIYGTPIIEDGIYSISSFLSKNKVLDILGSSGKNSANLQLWTKNNTIAQKFKFTYLGEGYYEIEACCSGKVLDVASAENKCGTNVWQYERKKYNNENQKWMIKSAGNECYYIISKCNGLYLDVSGAKIRNGTNIQVWDFNGTKAQKFKISK